MSINLNYLTGFDKKIEVSGIKYLRGGKLTFVIYVDKLLAVNLFIGVLMLLSASKICGIHIKRRGLIAGSLLSSASSLLIFLPGESVTLSVLSRIVAVTVIVYCSFFPQSLKSFFKSLGAFLTVNLIFAGIVLAIKFSLYPGVHFINGAVYFDISALMLIIMSAFCYGAIALGGHLTARRTQKNDKLEIEVSFRGKAVKTDALLDSGSSLKESFSGRPVIVSELKSIAGLLEPYELSFFKGDYLSARVPDTIKSSVRLIPYKAIGNEGLLPSFRADKVISRYKGKEYIVEGVFIGVVTKELSTGEYRAIANKLLFE